MSAEEVAMKLTKAVRDGQFDAPTPPFNRDDVRVNWIEGYFDLVAMVEFVLQEGGK